MLQSMEWREIDFDHDGDSWCKSCWSCGTKYFGG